VREYATPPLVDTPRVGSLSDDVVGHADSLPATVLFRRPPDHEGAGWSDVTAGEFRDEVVAVAKGLLASGVRHGDRVGLFSRTRYEWTLVDYACWWVGAVTVPVDGGSSPEGAAAVLADCTAVACIVETADQASALRAVAGDASPLRWLWALDDGGIEQLGTAGAAVTDGDVAARRAAVTPADLATVIYTAGTTGAPKGCCLSHANLMVQLGEATAALPQLFDDPDSCTLLFLPLAHVLARLVQVACVHSGVPLGHTSDTGELPDRLREFGPTFVVAVPRFFETFLASSRHQARGVARGRVFDAAVSTAISYSRALDAGGPGALLRARHRALDRLVFSRLRHRLGGRVRHAVTGSAPLGGRLGHAFRGMGVPVLEGYGLTETSAAISVNLPDAQKIGTVGRPLPGTTVRVADDGELLVRGDQVFVGYWGNREPPGGASSPPDDGWLHTGDVGEIDAEGFVRLTARKAEILVTAGGKKVAPTVLEDLIRSHPLVSQCLVVGDGRPYVAALLTLDPQAALTWSRRHGRSRNVAQLRDDPDLLAELQVAVDAANASVSHAEWVRRFAVLPAEWTEDDGYLTPSLILRRAVVLDDFRADVEALYD